MKRTLLEVLVIVVLMLAAGTAYTFATRKIDYVVPYRNARVCVRSGEAAGPPSPSGAPSEAQYKPPELSVEAPKTIAADSTGSTPPSQNVKDSASNTPPPSTTSIDKLPEIDFDEVFELWSDESLFIDARRTKDYVRGHIPGAVCISPYEPGLGEKIDKLRGAEPLEAPIVVYCTGSHDCVDSHEVGGHLKSAGFVSVSVYKGGYPEWQKREKLITSGEEAGPRGGRE
jgi:rhodanese-related sulfurtransferase